MQKKRYQSVVVFGMLIFYFIMIILTVSARAIHYRQIPNVVITRLKRVEINGKSGYAIPFEAYENGSVFIVRFGMKGGEKRSFVLKTDVMAGETDGNDILIESGLQRWDRIICQSDRKLSSGDEVYISK